MHEAVHGARRFYYSKADPPIWRPTAPGLASTYRLPCSRVKDNYPPVINRLLFLLPTIKLTSRNLEPYPSSFRLETKLAPSASYSHCHRRDVRPQLHARYEKPTLASIRLGTHRYFD